MPTLTTNAARLTAAKAAIASRLPAGVTPDYSVGSVLGAVVNGANVMADSVQQNAVQLWKAAFVDTATGSDLDALITGLGGPARNPAATATAGLTLTRGAYVGAYTITAGATVTGTAADGSTVSFSVAADIVLGGVAASATGTATAPSAGRDYNVAAATLVTISGLPAGLTLTQPSRAAGGADAETDAAYRARFRLRRYAFPGTRYGLEYAAKLVPGVTYAAVDEAAGAGVYVSLYIGDPDAESNSTLALAVRDILYPSDGTEGWAVSGVPVVVYGSERDERAFGFTVKIRRGAGITHDDIRAAAITYLDTLPPGATYYASGAETEIHAISDLVLSAVQDDPTAVELTPTVVYGAIRTADDGSDLAITLYEVDTDGTETLVVE